MVDTTDGHKDSGETTGGSTDDHTESSSESNPDGV